MLRGSHVTSTKRKAFGALAAHTVLGLPGQRRHQDATQLTLREALRGGGGRWPRPQGAHAAAARAREMGRGARHRCPRCSQVTQAAAPQGFGDAWGPPCLGARAAPDLAPHHATLLPAAGTARIGRQTRTEIAPSTTRQTRRKGTETETSLVGQILSRPERVAAGGEQVAVRLETQGPRAEGH